MDAGGTAGRMPAFHERVGGALKQSEHEGRTCLSPFFGWGDLADWKSAALSARMPAVPKKPLMVEGLGSCEDAGLVAHLIPSSYSDSISLYNCE